jgi:hypothetical protein
MTLITADRTSHYVKIADDIDAALGRGDDMGMELLISLLPDWTEAIEEINEGLRETDALLFEGLRDEAVGLHDAGFAAAATRLHVRDKPNWESARMFLDSQGVGELRDVDVESLAALNTAFAEIDAMLSPLGRLRRYALERASLSKRIKLLRAIRRHDPSKPIWEEQLRSHEEARLQELGEAVKRAIQAQDFHRLGELELELSDSQWVVSVPKKLREQTSGAGLWAELLQAVRELDATTTRLVYEWGQGVDAVALLDRVDELRNLRVAWSESECRCRELLFALPSASPVGRLAAESAIGVRIENLRENVADPLRWLEAVDQREAVVQSYRMKCHELEYLLGESPAGSEASQWLVAVARLEEEIRSHCQTMPELGFPELLTTRLADARAVAEHQNHRVMNRRRLLKGGVVACIGSVLGIVWWLLSSGIAYRADMKQLRELVEPARQGAFVALPERATAILHRWHGDAECDRVVSLLGESIATEVKRRSAFDNLLVSHATLLAAAEETADSRSSDASEALADWPDAFFDAVDGWKAARKIGGVPGQRGDIARVLTGELPPAVRARFDDEESQLADRLREEEVVERRFVTAAASEFRRRVKSVEGRTHAAERDADALRALLRELDELGDLAGEHRSARSTERKVGYRERVYADDVTARVKKLLDETE